MLHIRDYLALNYQIPPNELEEIVASFRRIQLQKKAFFLRAGDVCHEIAFISSGVMRNYAVDEKGQESVKYMTSDGDFNTVYQYFLNQKSCPENIQAVTDCELFVINREAFYRLKSQSPAFSQIIDELVLSGLSCKEERLHSYMKDDARQRYYNLIQSQPRVVQYSPASYIASYLGISRETLSRIRNKKAS